MKMGKNRISMMAARLFANMTEEEACIAIGVKRSRLLSWENGQSVPTHEHAAAMADAYGLSLDVISFQKEDNCLQNHKEDEGLSIAMKLIQNSNDHEFDLLRTVMSNSRMPAVIAQI